MTDTTTPTPRAKRPRSQQQRSRPAAPPPQQRTREVHPVLEKLFELYPKMFGAQFLPLKLGAFQDLLAENPDTFKRDELKIALGLHARSTRYLECVAAGLPRHNLQGEPVEPVAPEHVHHAILEVFRRRQARSKEDLRPKVRARLVAAIEASGLSREAYAERTRTQDEAANALLDEAFAEIAVQTAKREALMRAFEASGKTVEQFAEMYGMNPADVAQAVERTRQAVAAQPQ
jgi:ProP effector